MQPKRKQGSFQSIRLCSVMGCACSKEGVSRASSKPSKTSLSQGGGGPPSRQVSTLSERQQSTRYSGRLELTGKSGAAVAAVAVAAEKDYAQQRQRSHRHSGVLTSAPIPDPSSVARRPNRHGGVVGGDKTVVVAPVPAPTPSSFPSQNEAALVAAGWPTWLACVAGEAIKGWVPRRADSFEKLNKIGQGTYSNVYKARDIDSGKIVALKKVRFDNLEPESVRFMAREILILRRLRHPNIIGLEGLVTSRMSNSLYLVFEYMEHDLAGLAACPGIVFTEPQVKCYMQQLLSGLEHCHTSGVLHRDIKGSNLLLGNDGILKIADFGLATFYHPNQKQLLTSRVVTLWYRPPELLLGATDYGAAVDLWSTGCILAELLAGKPIMPGRTEVEQLHKIFKLCGSPSDDYWKKSKLPHATIFKPTQPYERCLAETFKDIPISALSLLDKLLAIEPLDRGTASSALRSEFFTTKPLACDPASLPHYPPSKEMDAKLRDAEARRQREAAKRATAKDHPSKAVPAPEPNSEVPVSHQKRPLLSHSGTKSKSEKFQPLEEDTAVGFPMEPPRQQNQQHQQHQHQGLPPRRAPVPVVPSVHHSLPTSVSGPISSASASSRSGPMGNPIASGAARRKKQSGGEDVRMAPQRVPPRSTKSFTVSEYATGSGDLTHLSSLAPTKGLSGSSELHQSIFKKTLESGRRVDMGNIRRDTDSSKDSSTTSSSSSRREGRAATRLIN